MSTNLNNAVSFETLENRELMSVSHHHPKHAAKAAAAKAAAAKVTEIVAPLTVLQNGNTLTVTGSTGADKISISQNGSTFTLRNGTWSSQVTGNFNKLVVKGNGGNDSITLDGSVTVNADVYGAAGNDTLTGGSANDRLFAGAGSNVLNGGNGNDTFVTIGSTADVVTGGLGNDSFWMDDSRTETITDLTKTESAAGHVHKISSFFGGVSTALNGQKLADPKLTDSGMTYKNFAGSTLFSDAGPSKDDVVQGYVGDCWYLSSLSSVAKVNADKICQSVVDLGDGTFAVQFNRNGRNVFVRVDADFATWGGSSLAYANYGKGNSVWVAVMEKAMATFFGSTPSFNSIDGGWMSDAYTALGLNSTDIWGTTSATDLFNQLAAAVNGGKAVTFAVGNVPSGAPLIGYHAYTVDKVDATNKTITLRNPWGVDGAGNDGMNDAYVTITMQQAFNAMLGVSIATV